MQNPGKQISRIADKTQSHKCLKSHKIKNAQKSHLSHISFKFAMEKQNGSLCFQADTDSEELQLYCQLQKNSAGTR